VRLNWGYIPANEARTVVFKKMIPRKQPPVGLKISKDKFRIQSFAVPDFALHYDKAWATKRISEMNPGHVQANKPEHRVSA
jgi:hypothetical protein